MTSRSFDGEYIARFIQRFGYGAVRGSSTRGGVGAIIEMARLMRAGCTTAFTSRWSEGPSLHRENGRGAAGEKSRVYPNLAVTMALEHYWTTPSWDLFQIPKPLHARRVYVAPPIYVPGRRRTRQHWRPNATNCSKLSTS
jgi:lysophospholipid acyltransferase (LPLAT)-like uncharacterized protein